MASFEEIDEAEQLRMLALKSMVRRSKQKKISKNTDDQDIMLLRAAALRTIAPRNKLKKDDRLVEAQKVDARNIIKSNEVSQSSSKRSRKRNSYLIEVIPEEVKAEKRLKTEHKPHHESKPRRETKSVTQSKPKLEAKSVLQSKPKLEVKSVLQSKPKLEAKSSIQSKPKLEAKSSIQSKPKLEAKSSIQSKPKLEAKYVVESKHKLEEETVLQSKPKLQSKLKLDAKSDLQSKPELVEQSKSQSKPETAIKEDIKKVVRNGSILLSNLNSEGIDETMVLHITFSSSESEDSSNECDTLEKKSTMTNNTVCDDINDGLKINCDSHLKTYSSKSKETELKVNTCLEKLVELMKGCELEIQKRNQQISIFLEAYEKYKTHSESLHSILESMKKVRNELSEFETNTTNI